MNERGFDFDGLREKWREVPQPGGRVFSDRLLSLPPAALLEEWQRHFTYYLQFVPARWHQILYREFMRDKTVLEIGSGLGFDGVLRLQEGAVKEWTFCDIVDGNLKIIERVCRELGVRANFVFIDDEFKCFTELGMFDVIWAKGSLINVPFDFARAECMHILPHLKPQGRWIELCYPRERWIREGRLPFSEWGKVTDGERTPWMEWYDLAKLQRRLFPAPLQVVLDFNFHNDAFNWFDLLLAGDQPFDLTRPVFDVDVFPAEGVACGHGDSELAYHDNALEFGTPEAMWSYAVSFDLTAAIARAAELLEEVDRRLSVEIDLKVAVGDIGVLVVADDLSVPVCAEFMIAASVDPATVTISVPAQAPARRLILRNAAATGRSRCTISRIRLRVVAAGDSPLRSLTNK